jgi:GNAT superfamily N-acetyltransferase
VSPTLRPVREDEVDGLTDLLHRAYAADEQLGVHFGAATVTPDQVLTHLRGNLAYALVDDDPATGMLATASLRLPWGPNPGPVGLPHAGWLAKDPDAPASAGHGLGRQALSLLEDQVARAQLHAPALTLGTAQDHPWLGDYYRSLGYRRIGSRDLGLGHITDYYLKPLDPDGYDAWSSRNADLLKGLAS